MTQDAVGIIASKQVKGKILAERINVGIEHIKLSQRLDSFLKQGKGKDRNGSKREEGHLGSAAAPACSTQSLMLCEEGREGPELRSPFHMDSWLSVQEGINGLDGENEANNKKCFHLPHIGRDEVKGTYPSISALW